MKGYGEPIEEHPGAGTKVLLVAPNASGERQVEAAFRRAGYVLVPCESLAAARIALREQRHAMVIVDRALSDSAGLDLLVSASGAAGAPVIVVTDDPDVHVRLSILRAGAVDCVGKPYDPLYLVARAVSVLNQQRGMPAVPVPGFARRLLVVDDSAASASRLAEELRKDGHDVAIALTAHEALAFGGAQEIDLAIVDALLPDMSGSELRGRLRSISALRRMPVLVLSEETGLRGSTSEGEPSDIVVNRHDLDSVRMHVRRMLSRDERQSPSSRRGAVAWSSMPPPSQRSAPPPPSQRSAPPPSSQQSVPPSQQSVPPSQQSVPPPQQSVPPPASRRSVPPPASRRSVPPPPSRRDVSREGPPSSRRFVPASSRQGAPASSRQGAPASSRQGAPASSRQGAPASSRQGASAPPPRPSRQIEAVSPLLEEIVAASGLSRLVAKGAIERACQRIGVPPSRLTRQHIERLVPEMEHALRAFLPAEAVAARMAELARLAED